MPVRVAAFLKRHLPALRTAPRARLVPFVEWYWHDGRVGVVLDHGRIVGVALARALHSAEEAAREWHHEETGRLVWVDHIAARHALGIPILLQQALQRFGPREAFAGDVFKRSGERRMLAWKTVERLANTTA